MAMASDSMTTICSHCEKDIPTINIQLHYVHCSRKLKKCSICGEFVPIKHADEHFKESHAPIDCSLCSETVEREGWSIHRDEKCPKRIVSCEFCEFPLPATELVEHQEVCGNRTELCVNCNKYVRLRELFTHEFYCQAHSNGVTESSGSWNESVVDSEGNRNESAVDSEEDIRNESAVDSEEDIRNESAVDSEEDIRMRQMNGSDGSGSVGRNDANEPGEEADRRRETTRGSSERRIMYSVVFAGFAILMGSFFLSRRA